MKKNNQKYIVQVAPVVPLPVLRTQVFSYWHEKELPAGTLVSVPFYFREVQGIVTDSKKISQLQRSLKLKNIKSIIEEKFLSENQIALARKIAEYYFAPLGSVLKLMVPKIIKLGEKSKKNKRGKQCLMLVPEVLSAESLRDKMQKELAEEVALIHGRITKKQYYNFWIKIKSGEIKIVIATKLGIFLPFRDLGLIVVQDGQDVSFKQSEAMPRYNGAKAAEFLAEISNAKLATKSPAPAAGDLPKIEIVLPDSKTNPDFPISKILSSRLADALERKKQAVVFVNRRGFSTRTTCENCKKVLKCPKCEKPLVYSDDAGKYKCLHCAFTRDVLSACPNCGGFQFSHRGVGTQTVEKKLKKLFPSARIARLDADAMKSLAKFKDILRKFAAGELDILVGTQSAIKGIYSENIALAAAVSVRDFADGFEFNSRSIALSRIFNMAKLSGGKGQMLIQSFAGGNPLFDIFNEGNPKKYFDGESKIRERFGYPPFKRLIRLAYRDKSEKKVASETKKTIDLLRKMSDNKTEIIGPYEGFSWWKRGLYMGNILLKVDSQKDVGDLPIRSVLGGLRKGWSVDVDPVSLF